MKTTTATATTCMMEVKITIHLIYYDCLTRTQNPNLIEGNYSSALPNPDNSRHLTCFWLSKISFCFCFLLDH